MTTSVLHIHSKWLPFQGVKLVLVITILEKEALFIMSFMHRAVMYVTRKKGKSILLFLVLFVIATFVLTGISIKDASQAASTDLRESLGGRFTIYIDMSKDNPYVVTERTEPSDGGKLSINSYSTGPLISTETLESVKSVGGIKNYYASEMWQPHAENFNLLRGKLPIKDGYENMVNAIAVSGTEASDFFTARSIQLSEGRHILPKDRHVAVISRALAEENKLKVGDSLKLGITDSVANQLGINPRNKIELTIVGLFQPTGEDQITEMTSAYNMIENRVFTDIYSQAELFNSDKEPGFSEATFFAQDPDQLNSIVEKVEALPSIDWKQFNVSVDNEAYSQAAAPLNNLSRLVKILLIIMMAVSVAILSLLLTLWMRNRVYETGVFLALGIHKFKILGQYVTEVLLIAIVAFGISYFSGNAIAENVGNALLQQQLSRGEPSEQTGTVAVSSAVVAEPIAGTEALNSIEVKVTSKSFVQLYLIGTLIIVIAVGMSSVSVMRLNPKEILSKMS